MVSMAKRWFPRKKPAGGNVPDNFPNLKSRKWWCGKTHLPGGAAVFPFMTHPTAAQWQRVHAFLGSIDILPAKLP
jgi:hypothetical protein